MVSWSVGGLPTYCNTILCSKLHLYFHISYATEWKLDMCHLQKCRCARLKYHPKWSNMHYSLRCPWAVCQSSTRVPGKSHSVTDLICFCDIAFAYTACMFAPPALPNVLYVFMTFNFPHQNGLKNKLLGSKHWIKTFSHKQFNSTCRVAGWRLCH